MGRIRVNVILKKTWLGLYDMDYRDKAYDMNPLIYKNAEVILESYNQEGLHETVLNVINVLSYNAAWDFKTESDTDTRRIIRTVISFKYNGTITAINSLNKIKIPKDVKVQVKLCT